MAQVELAGPARIDTLLATEDYFSTKVQFTLVRPAGLWVARFQVSPGEPTKFTSVRLNYQLSQRSSIRTSAGITTP